MVDTILARLQAYMEQKLITAHRITEKYSCSVQFARNKRKHTLSLGHTLSDRSTEMALSIVVEVRPLSKEETVLGQQQA